MDDAVTVTVLYSCRGCGLKDREIAVPERAPHETVVLWMLMVQAMVGTDHAFINPFCWSQHCDLKIPLPKNADYIGQGVRQ